MKMIQLLAVLLITSATFVLANPTDVKSLSQSRTECLESYFPCTCEVTSNGWEVTCLDVSIEDIKNVFFNSRAPSLYSVTLRASETKTVDLPFDILSNKVTQRLSLQCPPAASPPLTLTINSAAFQFTRRTTSFFEIKDCDLTAQADFSFLSGFEVLETLRLERTLSIGAFASLPSVDMRGLKQLEIIYSTGLGGIAFPDLTPATLERLYLDGNKLIDTDINIILESVGSSSSVSSLQELTLTHNSLNKVPSIGPFSNLSRFDVSSNKLSYISESGLNFGALTKVNFVGLKDSTISFISDGAFVGDFTNCEVNLEDNKLTEFREGAFKDILTQMTVQPPAIGGRLIVTNNAFDCGCSLAWLIRDNPNLIPSVINGVCGDFFRFEDLNPASYNNCP